jgi:hypothetical protein
MIMGALLSKKPNEEKKDREITFKCKYCGKNKPLEDMRRIDRFSPPLVACRECEKKLR